MHSGQLVATLKRSPLVSSHEICMFYCVSFVLSYLIYVRPVGTFVGSFLNYVYVRRRDKCLSTHCPINCTTSTLLIAFRFP